MSGNEVYELVLELNGWTTTKEVRVCDPKEPKTIRRVQVKTTLHVLRVQKEKLVKTTLVSVDHEEAVRYTD